MSGPKVVRVVTREELVAAGESLLHRLDEALSEWERTCAALGVSPTDQKSCKDRRDELEKMLRADKFGEFGQAAVAEIDFLESDASRRRERAAQARAQERARLVSGRELASVLLRQVTNDAPERPALELAAAGELTLKELDAVLARARLSMFRPTTTQLSATQQTLAARLAGSESSMVDFEEWREKLVGGASRLEALLAHISELELLGEASRADELHKEVLTAAAIEDDGLRGMRLDSMVVALKKAKDDVVARERLRRQVALVAAELERFNEAAEVIAVMRAAAAAPASDLRRVLEVAEEQLREFQQAQVAAARRKAVLDGLQQLGYQVHEQLSTITSKGGRLVVSNPATAGYGVEIAAGAGLERLQVRAVAFDMNRDAAGDIPAEQRWCDDFGALSGVLKAMGSSLIVEKALGVGAVPMKLAVSAQPEGERRTSNAPLHTGRKS
ncbi:hypothetical protein [Hydrogenophaga flava]|uniref:hypothetical protein n=1 Tax=Hydrogenophaga flava TaxID=65657 RepID=UPI000B016BB8|nr:hypothetical protein [Hydrogenophaga flava]